MPYSPASDVSTGWHLGGTDVCVQYPTATVSLSEGYLLWTADRLNYYPYQTVTCGTTVTFHQWLWVADSAPLTDAEIIERAATAELARQAAQVAASRADQLLMSFLSQHQAESYQRDKFFDVVVPPRTYRINKGRSGNVMLIEDGKPVAKYCAHPEIWTPDGDTMLSQLLMLQTDETRFLQTANRTALC